MPELPSRLRETLDALAFFPDRVDRIQQLISIADRFRGVPSEVAERPFPEEHRVKGCESEVFVWAKPNPQGTLDLHFAVENPQGVSAMALAVILEEGLSGVPLEEVATVPADVVFEIFGHELSMGKSMGLMGMVTAVTSIARRAAR